MYVLYKYINDKKGYPCASSNDLLEVQDKMETDVVVEVCKIEKYSEQDLLNRVGYGDVWCIDSDKAWVKNFETGNLYYWEIRKGSNY